jgi:hypothetical protein
LMNHRVTVRTYEAHVSYRINVVCGFRLRNWREMMHFDEALAHFAIHSLEKKPSILAGPLFAIRFCPGFAGNLVVSEVGLEPTRR